MSKTFVFKHFDGGMMSAADAKDRPPITGALVRNVDAYSAPGIMRKTTGVSIYDFAQALTNGKLPNGEQILSIGRLVYNKIWNDAGTVEINQLTELCVIQFNGTHGLDWYELERPLGTDTWVLSGAMYCGWNADTGLPEYSTGFEGLLGVTKAGKIHFLENNGVLRAACGAFINAQGISDSFPVQWRYVNRLPIANADPEKNKGWFKIFDSADADVGECRAGFQGIVRSRSFIKDFIQNQGELVQLLEKPNGVSGSPYAFHQFLNFGYGMGKYLKYAICPVYDGHQIFLPYIEFNVINPFTVQFLGNDDYTWCTKFSIAMNYMSGGILAWTEQRPTGDVDEYWYGCALAVLQDVDKFIACDFGGRVWTYNGTVWVEQRPVNDADKQWQGVSFATDGGRKLVGVFGGRLWMFDGSVWTEQRPGNIDANKNWQEVAASGDGLTFITGANLGRLWTYAANTWNQQVPDGIYEDKHWKTFAASNDGAKFIAGEYGGKLWRFLAGGWERLFPAGWNAERNWHGCDISDDGVKLIVCCSGVDGRLYSLDSGTWTQHYPDGIHEDKDWECVAISVVGTGVKYLAGIGGSGGRLYFGYGTNWIELTPAGDVDQCWRSCGISADGTKYIAAAYGGRLWTFAGGVWTEQVPDGVYENKEWYVCKISRDGTKFIAGVDDGRLWYYDGINWIEQRPGSDINQLWHDVDISNSGTKYIVGAYEGRLYTGVGDSWTERYPTGIDENKDWKSCKISGDGTKYIAASTLGRLWTSADGGITWTERRPDTIDANNNWVSVGISENGTKYIAATKLIPSYQGRIWTFDGLNWTERAPDGVYEDKYWECCDISGDGTKFIACEHNGRLWYFDGVNWIEQRPDGVNEDKPWQFCKISQDGTKLIAGISGGALWIRDGGSWNVQLTEGNWFCGNIDDSGKAIAGINGGRLQSYIFPPQRTFSSRLTGLNVYVADKELQFAVDQIPYADTIGLAAGLSNYKLLYAIDLKDGVENILQVTGQFIVFENNYYIAIIIATSALPLNTVSDDMFNNMFIKFDTVEEEYVISDSFEVNTYPGAPVRYYLKFTPKVGTGLVLNSNYSFTINSRWKKQDQANRAEINLLDLGTAVNLAPPWLDSSKDLVNQPKIDCNYGKSTMLKGQHFAMDVAYDDKLEPNMLRKSYPIGSDFGGDDILDEVIVPDVFKDDKIMDCVTYLDRLYVFTKNKILQYLTTESGVDVINEFPWDIGLDALDSIIENDTRWWFLGRKRDKTALYVWDGQGRPREVSDRILDYLERCLKLPNCRKDLAQGVHLPLDKKYLLDIPYYVPIDPTLHLVETWETVTTGQEYEWSNYPTQKSIDVLPEDCGEFPAGTIIVCFSDYDYLTQTPERKFYYKKPEESVFSLLTCWVIEGATVGGNEKFATTSFRIGRHPVSGIYKIYAVSNQAREHGIPYVFYNDMFLGVYDFITRVWTEVLLYYSTNVDEQVYYPDIDISPDNNHAVAVWTWVLGAVNKLYRAVIYLDDFTFNRYSNGLVNPALFSVLRMSILWLQGDTIALHIDGYLDGATNRDTTLWLGEYDVEELVNVTNTEEVGLCDPQMVQADNGNIGFISNWQTVLPPPQDNGFYFCEWSYRTGLVSDPVLVIPTDYPTTFGYGITFRDGFYHAFGHTRVDPNYVLRHYKRAINGTAWTEVSEPDSTPNVELNYMSCMNTHNPTCVPAYFYGVVGKEKSGTTPFNGYYRLMDLTGAVPPVNYYTDGQLDRAVNIEVGVDNNAITLRGDNTFDPAGKGLAAKQFLTLSDDTILIVGDNQILKFDKEVVEFAGNQNLTEWVFEDFTQMMGMLCVKRVRVDFTQDIEIKLQFTNKAKEPFTITLIKLAQSQWTTINYYGESPSLRVYNERSTQLDIRQIELEVVQVHNA